VIQDLIFELKIDTMSLSGTGKTTYGRWGLVVDPFSTTQMFSF